MDIYLNVPHVLLYLICFTQQRIDENAGNRPGHQGSPW